MHGINSRPNRFTASSSCKWRLLKRSSDCEQRVPLIWPRAEREGNLCLIWKWHRILHKSFVYVPTHADGNIFLKVHLTPKYFAKWNYLFFEAFRRNIFAFSWTLDFLLMPLDCYETVFRKSGDDDQKLRQRLSHFLQKTERKNNHCNIFWDKIVFFPGPEPAILSFDLETFDKHQ